ncbi:MAG: glycosyltransferase family 2 protein [Clostridiales bacterium]|nr:glycosyltransferase family 2 protein [Clostridiales bacterium]
MPSLSIAIVTYNSEKTIGRTLASLFANIPQDIPCHVTIIDNGSTDGTLASLEPYQNQLRLLHSQKGNIGFGAAHNLIMPELNSDIHIIMNPDINAIDRQSFTALVDYLLKHQEVGMVVPRIIDENGSIQYLCRRDPTLFDLFSRVMPEPFFRKRRSYHEMKDHDYTTSFRVPFASGCLMAIRSELFKRLGGFDERYFLYAEDADLSRQVNQVSTVMYVPDAVFCHVWQRSSYKSSRMAWIHIRSLMKYFSKWGWAIK